MLWNIYVGPFIKKKAYILEQDVISDVLYSLTWKNWVITLSRMCKGTEFWSFFIFKILILDKK